MSLKGDMRKAEQEIRDLRNVIAKLEESNFHVRRANGATQYLILSFFNDMSKAKTVKEFRDIQKAIKPLMDEKAKHFDVCLPTAEDEELCLVVKG